MDFSAALANLEKSANEATHPRNNSINNRRRPRSPNDHDHRQHQRPRSTRDHLTDMARFGYRVRPYERPAPPTETPENGKGQKVTFHIALLAITIDELPFEEIWKHWALQQDGCDGNVQVSLLCHSKHPENVKSAWLKRRLIVERPVKGRGSSWADPVVKTYRPEWGSVEIARAMVDLMREGLTVGVSSQHEHAWEREAYFSRKRFLVQPDEDAPIDHDTWTHRPVDKFVFISETCLPVVTLSQFIHDVTRDCPHDSSWVNARNVDSEGTPRNKYEHDQFTNIHRMIPPIFRWKADQWMILSRPHAKAVMDIDEHMRHPNDQLWNSFARINASDEMYFPTALGVLGILKSAPCSSVCQRPVTFTDWTQGMRNPATFESKSQLGNVVSECRSQGCLFARKFSGPLSVSEWRNIVLPAEEGNSTVIPSKQKTAEPPKEGE